MRGVGTSRSGGGARSGKALLLVVGIGELKVEMRIHSRSSGSAVPVSWTLAAAARTEDGVVTATGRIPAI